MCGNIVIAIFELPCQTVLVNRNSCDPMNETNKYKNSIITIIYACFGVEIYNILNMVQELLLEMKL